MSVRLLEVRLGSEAHRQVGPHRACGPIHPFGQILHGSRPHWDLARHRVGLDRANLKHVRREVEVTVQAGARVAGRPMRPEGLIRGSREHVRVDQGAAAPTISLDAQHPIQPAEVEEPTADLPQPVRLQIGTVSWQRPSRPTPTALRKSLPADPPAPAGQPPLHRQAATHHNGVEAAAQVHTQNPLTRPIPRDCPSWAPSLVPQLWIMILLASAVGTPETGPSSRCRPGRGRGCAGLRWPCAGIRWSRNR